MLYPNYLPNIRNTAIHFWRIGTCCHLFHKIWKVLRFQLRLSRHRLCGLMRSMKELLRRTKNLFMVWLLFFHVSVFGHFCSGSLEASVYKGYKRDKIEMRGDRAEMSDFPLYLNTVAGGLDCRNQAIGGFSFVVKIYALPVVEIIGQFLYLLGRYGFDAQIGYCF